MELTMSMGANPAHEQGQHAQHELLEAREQNCNLRASLLKWKQSYAQLQTELHCARQTAQADQARAVAECLRQTDTDCQNTHVGLQVCAYWAWR